MTGPAPTPQEPQPIGEPLPPGEQLNHGEPTRPRPAATVLLLRGGSELLEVLLVQRSPGSRFMASAWVFPGGAVDPHEGEGEPAYRRAAVREVREETGVELDDPRELLLISRWVTPPELRFRFDTCFFAAGVPADQHVRIDETECVDHGWFRPDTALARYRDGTMRLVLPTIRHLQLLGGYADADSALAALRARPVEHVAPRLEGDGERAHVVVEPRTG